MRALHSKAFMNPEVTPEQHREYILKQANNRTIAYARAIASKFAYACLFRAEGDRYMAADLINCRRWAEQLLIDKWRISPYAFSYCQKLALLKLKTVQLVDWTKMDQHFIVQ